MSDGDEYVLPEIPSSAELALAGRLGDGLVNVDERILKFAKRKLLKVARVVLEALQDGGFSSEEEGVVDLHIRRVVVLVDAGKLEGVGNLRRPRFSEVRLPEAPHG